jgi:hypothetical protein
MSWNQAQCTCPHQELSKDTKNTNWTTSFAWCKTKQNKLPSFIDRWAMLGV